MMNYKKLKKGFSMAELLVALSIFALISTLGLGALGFMLKIQYQNQNKLEENLLKEAKISSCLKQEYYSNCNSLPQDPGCSDPTIANLSIDHCL
jgi:prepilin-type N-terminal cleavage/methylation domain-containing protein